MRFITALVAFLAVAGAATAALVPDQQVTVSTSDYTPDAVDDVASAKLDTTVGAGDVDTQGCSTKELDGSSCQKSVASGTPKAQIQYETDVGLLDFLLKAQQRADAGDGPATAGSAFVAVDEGNVVYLAKAVAGVSIVGIAAWLTGRVARYGLLGFLPMYTYIRDGDLLKDPNRARIFELIKAEPGISTKDIADRLGLAWGTVTHHLGKLEKRQFVVSKKYGKYRRYFANGAAADQVKKDTLAILKVAATAEVAHLVRDRPGASQKEVSEALGVSSSTILWHVKRLEKVGLVSKVRDGKLVRYYPGQMLSGEWQPTRDLVTPLA